MAKIFNLFHWKRDRMERDLARELESHVDHRVHDLIERGVSEADARRRAAIEFGRVAQIQEDVRETWTWAWVDALMADVRYSIRGLGRRWGFSLGTTAVLALGIGATVAIFSVINTVLLQPLPYPDAERLVSVETFWTNTGRTSQDVSGPDFLDWRAQSAVFEQMAVSNGGDNDGNVSATIVGDRAVFSNARYVSADFFAVFGQVAAAGRLLTERDVPTGDAMPTTAVAAHHWAVAHYGSAEAAIGKQITVYSLRLEIVGVATPGFRYPGASDIWAPWPTASDGTSRSHYTYRAVGKLKPGVDVTRAQAEMQTIGANLARAHPENRVKSVAVIPLQARLTGDVQIVLWVLMGAVFVVLLIACANVSNLLLARAAVRTREIALRTALGAGRRRLVRQLLTESGVLGAIAGAIGLVLAFILMRGLVAMSPANLPRLDDVRLDTTVVLFALGLSLVATVLFGLVPALHASRLDLSDALKQGGAKTTGSRSASRLRAGLVVTEVALSVTLLAAAGLLLRSFQTLNDVDLGFTTNRVLVAYTDYAVSNEKEILVRSSVYADLLDRLRAVPGVSAAAGIAFLPMGREPRAARDYFIQGRPEGRPGERPQAELYAITPDYFRTLEIPVRAGRDFDRTDTPERPRVAIVNETLARSAFPGTSAVGQHIRTNSDSPWMEIVGVVGDTRWQNPSQQPPSVLFVASLQGAGKSLSILARTSVDATSLAGTIRSLLHEANPTVPVKFETMEELHEFALAHPWFRTRVIGLFAAVSALLAAVGIFTVLAYLVGQRTRELAVRRALGAPTADVIRLIVGQGMRLVAIGLVLGLAGAVAVARLLTGLLYEVSPWHPGPYVGALLVIGVAALLAALIPAIRAATVAPLIALEQE